MWVRIPSFPPEYYNFDCIKTILDFNNVGTLLKLDPNASKRISVKFVRFCINLDCSKSISKDIVIPDESGNMKKFTLWFEDIPQGCGNCGELDHSFNSCHLRKFIPPKFKITFKKPSPNCISVQNHSPEDVEWKSVSKKGKGKTRSSDLGNDNKGKKADDFGGIGVIYITDDLPMSPKVVRNWKRKMKFPPSTKCSTGNPNGLLEANQEGVPVLLEDPSLSMNPNAFRLPPTLDQEDVVANQHYISEFNYEKNLAEADDSLFYYQENENANWAKDEGGCLFEDHTFLEATFEDNLNSGPLPDLPMEESSFHSMNSENSMLQHLAQMELKRAGLSTSGSGKKKNQGGDGDTASSDMVGHKKPKI